MGKSTWDRKKDASSCLVQDACQNPLCYFVFLCVKVLPAPTFSQGSFFSACAVTRLLIHLGLLEGSRKAAPAQNTRGTGRARKKFLERKKVFSPDRPYALVIFVSATVRPRPSEPKSISTRETSQAAKKEIVENNKRTRILTRQKTKSQKGFAHVSCTRQDEESFFLSHVLLPV